MTTTLEKVTVALAPTQTILEKEYNRQLQEKFTKFVAQLTADGMDANKNYDYPSGSMDKVSYRAQAARYYYMEKHSAPVKGSRSMREPNLRTIDEVATRAKIAAQAAELAKAALEGYCFKLAGKIEAGAKLRPVPIVDGVRYEGGLNPWGWSFVHVSFGDAAVGAAAGNQTWKTKMIVNVSCLGKVFNQWPTRLVK